MNLKIMRKIINAFFLAVFASLFILSCSSNECYEINFLNDSALIKAILMNYMCKFVGESGIGFLYPSVLIFESVKKDFKLEIPYSDVLKLGGG